MLDVGSGTGFYVGLWREAGAASIRGSDVSPTAVARLRTRAFPAIRIDRFDLSGAAEDLPDGPFDLVSAFDVLFHLIDDAAYGRALAKSVDHHEARRHVGDQRELPA